MGVLYSEVKNQHMILKGALVLLESAHIYIAIIMNDRDCKIGGFASTGFARKCAIKILAIATMAERKSKLNSYYVWRKAKWLRLELGLGWSLGTKHPDPYPPPPSLASGSNYLCSRWPSIWSSTSIPRGCPLYGSRDIGWIKKWVAQARRGLGRTLVGIHRLRPRVHTPLLTELHAQKNAHGRIMGAPPRRRSRGPNRSTTP